MIVYKYTNKLNGKQYIGQTIRSFEERHKDHLRANSTYFDRALSKYGEESFDWEILYRASDADELNAKEVELIQKHNTLKPNGYNVTLGGNSFNGYSHSPETRKKISEAIKDFYKRNPNHLRGESSPCYGIRWNSKRKLEMSKIKKAFWDGNDEARGKMSEIKKSHYKNNPELVKLKSEQTKEWIATNGHPFKGKKHTNESRAKMSESLKGRELSDEWREKISKNNARKRRVINLDTGEIFNTIKSAADSVGKNKSSISNVCRGQRNTCGGYRWAYLNELEMGEQGKK